MDSEVARQLKATIRRQKMSLKAAVNQALRIGLAMEAAPKESRRFRVKADRSGLLPGFDPHRLSQLADEVEDEAVLVRSRACGNPVSAVPKRGRHRNHIGRR